MNKIGSCSVIFPDAYNERDIVPSLEVLFEKGYSLAPGLSSGFWNNMRCTQFIRTVFIYILERISKDSVKPKGKDNYIFPAHLENCLLTLINIVFSDKYTVAEAAWKPLFESFFMFRDANLSQVVLKLQTNLEGCLTSFKTHLDDIVVDHKNRILNDAIPIHVFMYIIRYLHNNPKALNLFYAGMKSRLEIVNSISESIIMLHLLNVIATLFPGFSKYYMSLVLPSISNYLAKPAPVSDIAQNVGHNIEKELNYSGYMYYSHLYSLCSTNMAFDGAIPTLFDQKSTSFTNFLFSRFSKFNSVQSCLVNYAQYMVKNQLRSSKEITQDRAISILNGLTFDEEGMQSIKAKYKLKDDIPLGETIDPSPMVPAILPLRLCRLSFAFQPNPAMLTEIEGGKYLFTSPMQMILDKAFLSQIKERIVELNDQTSIVKQPVIIAGDDYVISNILQGLYSAFLGSPRDFSRIAFKFFLIPINRESVNEVSRFIGKNDPVYRLFMENSFDLVSSIGPTHNEESMVSFPTIVEKESKYDHNIWFTDPSPTNIFQFSIQHYVQFANHTMGVNVWVCEMIFEADPTKKVIMPWITSVHIGNQFCGPTLVPSPKLSTKVLPTLTVKEVMNKEETFEKCKLRSLSIWNIGSEMNLKPSDQWLIAEWTPEKFALKDEKRSKFANKITSKLITELTFSACEKKPSFKCLIDQREFGPLRQLKIYKLMDPTNPGIQLSLNFASFMNSPI